MEKNLNRKTNWILLSTGMIACLTMRLIPLRAPNVEPIFATQMPFAKAYGKFAGFIFGFSSVLLYDFVTSTFGVWSIVTSLSYGMLGYFSAKFFQNKKPSRKNFAIFAVIGTIFYDAVTGLTVGPLVFHQSFFNALVGQIPFTALHIFGNVIFAIIISPALYNFLLRHQRLKFKKSEVALSINPITN